jgi:putative ABC transport system permease protein
MNSATDIAWVDLAVGYLLLILPLLALSYYRTGLVKDALLAVGRMSVQLFLVGLYLEFIFKLNNLWINLLWVVVMVVFATYTIIGRSTLSYKIYWIPLFCAITFSLIVVIGYCFIVIIKPEYFFEARYMIPIVGMLLGNCIQSNIIGLDAYYSRLREDQLLYYYALGNGATREEALFPFMRDALKKATNPAIASMAIIGLISLPGMMTGQILGGSNPSVAIKYQIMIMIAIFTASLLTVISTIFIANKFAFDDFDNFKSNALPNR